MFRPIDSTSGQVRASLAGLLETLAIRDLCRSLGCRCRDASWTIRLLILPVPLGHPTQHRLFAPNHIDNPAGITSRTPTIAGMPLLKSSGAMQSG
jgi:hypothetical protein